MKLTNTKVKDAKLIQPLQFGDERGFFSPVFDDQKFAAVGINDHFCRLNNSLSAVKGTIRGLHFQPFPDQEAKMIRVIRGSIWDIAVDLRQNSPTYKNWTGVTLSAENRSWFYIPPGCAHGFQTLEDDVEIIYLCSHYYSPKTELGLRWNDSAFSISWPLEATVISEKDRHHPDFNPSLHSFSQL